jgi:hypothetical protein
MTTTTAESSLHLRAMTILAEAGKGASYTGDEYFGALIRAEAESTVADAGRHIIEDGHRGENKLRARNWLAERTEQILGEAGKIRGVANVDDYLAALAQAEAEMGELAEYAQVSSKGSRR